MDDEERDDLASGEFDNMDSVIHNTVYPTDELKNFEKLPDDIEIKEEAPVQKKFFTLYFSIKGQIAVAASTLENAKEFAKGKIDPGIDELLAEDNVILFGIDIDEEGKDK